MGGAAAAKIEDDDDDKSTASIRLARSSRRIETDDAKYYWTREGYPWLWCVLLTETIFSLVGKHHRRIHYSDAWREDWEWLTDETENSKELGGFQWICQMIGANGELLQDLVRHCLLTGAQVTQKQTREAVRRAITQA